MTQSEQLNEYQQHNQHSIKEWERLFGMSFMEIIRHVNWKDLGFDNNMFDRFVCVTGGERVSMANLNFYNFDIMRVKCYKHQQDEGKPYFTKEFTNKNV